MTPITPRNTKLLLCLVAIFELFGTGCIWWGPERRGDRGGRGGEVIIEGGHDRDHREGDRH
jgi:hypothetical protein